MATTGEEHFKNLVAVAFADGIMDEREEELLSLKALEFGLSQSTVDSIINTADQLQFLIPRTIIDRSKQMSESIHMATIDGELHNKEYHLLISLANRLGFTKTDVDKEIEKQSIGREIIRHTN